MTETTPEFPADLWPVSPYEVEQGVGWGYDRPTTQPVALHLCPDPWFDDDHEQDSHHYGDEGGPQVVCDGEDAHPAARLWLHWRQTRH